MSKSIYILGTRGVPAAHGGFETFAEFFALYLVERGWDVTVYCQELGKDKTYEDEWNGVRRVHISIPFDNPFATILFDLICTFKVVFERKGGALVLGYNTAVFSLLYRLTGIRNVINMDGIEWKRAKWGKISRAWFYINEWLGCWFGNQLVADHPEIKNHLTRCTRPEKITMIPYGADRLEDQPVAPLKELGVEPLQFATVIARPEPENSILEIVQAFSRKQRNFKLLVLGNYSPDHPFQSQVLKAASDEVLFPGAIYDVDIVQSLRKHSLFYVHGHTVGGTNPSLVEAMGSGRAILAHGNKFNRWVVGEEGAAFFTSVDECEQRIETLISNPDYAEELAAKSLARFDDQFTWPIILDQYRELMEQYC